MSKPDDIPQDIWDEAWGADAWARPHYAPLTSEADKTDVVVAIARAIMAERERCARVIEENDIIDGSEGQFLRPRLEGNQQGLVYAAAIRKGGA